MPQSSTCFHIHVLPVAIASHRPQSTCFHISPREIDLLLSLLLPLLKTYQFDYTEKRLKEQFEIAKIDYCNDRAKKTFLNNTILTYAQSHNYIALAVASTGIASMLLLGGNTAHSQFEIPLDLSEHSTCNITKQSKLGKLLQKVTLIIWDEAPMIHRYAFDALDCTLQDLHNSQECTNGRHCNCSL
jgi:hypothetical protein